MIWVRSLVFQIYFFVSVCAAAMCIFVCWPMSYRVRFGIARLWARSMLWGGEVICGLRYVINGAENIPAEPCIIMSKHTTVFETYALMAVFPPQSWVLKRELLWIPLFGWGLAAMRPIAIDRDAGQAAVKQVIERGCARLAEGIWVTIFPEGTRVGRGETRRYGVSGAALAQEAGCLIVPVAHNAGDFWPRRGVRKRPGLIRLCIGPAISAADGGPRETNRRVQEWVEATMQDISEGYPSPKPNSCRG